MASIRLGWSCIVLGNISLQGYFANVFSHMLSNLRGSLTLVRMALSGTLARWHFGKARCARNKDWRKWCRRGYGYVGSYMELE